MSNESLHSSCNCKPEFHSLHAKLEDSLRIWPEAVYIGPTQIMLKTYWSDIDDVDPWGTLLVTGIQMDLLSQVTGIQVQMFIHFSIHDTIYFSKLSFTHVAVSGDCVKSLTKIRVSNSDTSVALINNLHHHRVLDFVSRWHWKLFCKVRRKTQQPPN